MGGDTRPRRLILNPAELELLRRRSGDLPLPEDFRLQASGGPDIDEALAAAVGTLAGRGVVEPDPGGDPLSCQVHASVRANLGVLTGSEVLLTTRARYRDEHVQAAYAVAGPLGASLVRTGGRAAELSMFAAAGLGRELVRTVPRPGTGRTWDRPVTVHLDALLLTGLGPVPTNGNGSPVKGRGPTGPVRPASGSGPDAGTPSPADMRTARRLERDSVGLLRCLVLGPARANDGATIGQVVWFALPGGWLGATPTPGPHGERLIRLLPVERADLPAWLAPLVGGALQ